MSLPRKTWSCLLYRMFSSISMCVCVCVCVRVCVLVTSLPSCFQTALQWPLICSRRLGIEVLVRLKQWRVNCTNHEVSQGNRLPAGIPTLGLAKKCEAAVRPIEHLTHECSVAAATLMFIFNWWSFISSWYDTMSHDPEHNLTANICFWESKSILSQLVHVMFSSAV